jgi:hypothetical protein
MSESLQKGTGFCKKAHIFMDQVGNITGLKLKADSFQLGANVTIKGSIDCALFQGSSGGGPEEIDRLGSLLTVVGLVGEVEDDVATLLDSMQRLDDLVVGGTDRELFLEGDTKSFHVHRHDDAAGLSTLSHILGGLETSVINSNRL